MKIIVKVLKDFKKPTTVHPQNLCTEVTIFLGLHSEKNNFNTSSESPRNTDKQSLSHVAVHHRGRMDTDIRKQEVPTFITTKPCEAHTEFTLNTSISLNVLILRFIPLLL